MSSFNSQNPLSYTGTSYDTNPPIVQADRSPLSSDVAYPLGTVWIDRSSNAAFTYVAQGTWDRGANPLATTAVPGIVLLYETDSFAGADDSTVPTSLTVKTYVDNIAIAGAPVSEESVFGLVKLSSDATAVAGTANTPGVTANVVQPSNLAAVFAAPPVIGGTTPANATFDALTADGLLTASASALIETAGTALNLATDNSADAVNIALGTSARAVAIANSAAAHTVAIGSDNGAASMTLKVGTGNFVLNGAATSTYAIGAATTSGTITIGGTAQTGNMVLGSSSGTNTVAVGNGTGATTVNISNGNAAGAVNVGAAFTTGTITIGGTAQTGTMTLGSSSDTNTLIIAGGAGATTVQIANAQTAGSVAIGNAMTTGTITIGGTASQTGTVTLSASTATQTVNIANANGAKTINIGSGVTGNTISLGNGANSAAQTINIAAGASAANSTVNILSGNGSAGTQTCNILTGTRAGAFNLATGAAAHVVTIGSASAGAIAVDTAAGISLDAATASNFSVSGAGQDLTLASTLGSIVIDAGEAVINAVRINASNAAGGIDIDAGSAGIAVDTTGLLSLDAAGNVNLTTSSGTLLLDCTGVLELNSSAGAISVGNDAVSQAVNIGTAGARTVTVGSTTGASALVLQSGTGRTTMTGTVKEIDAEFLYSSGTDLVVSQSPICQSNANTGVAPTGANGDVNLMYLQDGCLMEQFIIGTQTIIAPRMTANGLNIALDNTNAEGAEYNFGARANAKHVYTIGTDAAFYCEATIYVEDLSGCAPLMVGFRKVEANNATIGSYTDYACIGLNTVTSATNATILSELNGGGQTATDTGDAWGGDGSAQSVAVKVSAAGVVTFEVGGSAASAAPAFTFDNGDNVMFFCHFLNGADVAGEVSLQSLKIGYQA